MKVKTKDIVERLTCKRCKKTIGSLSNSCSNSKCSMYNHRQEGIMRKYK